MRHERLTLLLLTTLTTVLHAADWPSFRGPDGLGVTTEKNLPIEWSKDKGIVWHRAISGKGASSPIVVGDRVYITAQTADTALHLIALDRKRGEIIWDVEIARGNLHANNLHNMATPSATSDGTHVWALFGTGDLACVDQQGKVIWQRNLAKEYGENKTNHGYGSSPMLRDGRLYVVNMHQGPSYVLALDPKTGKNLWKKDRNFELKDEAQDSYSSPVFLTANARIEMIVAGAEGINAYDPATGEQIWICDGLKVPHPYGRTIAGPTAGEGVVIAVASGFQNRGYTLGLKTGGKGKITDTHRLWTCSKFSSDCPTPVIYDGMVFFIRDDGIASCLDLKTGEPHWQERVYSANVKVSPVAGDGKIYFMNGQGNCAVVRAAPKLEVLATNELKEATLSTPAISHSQLLLRTDGGVYCIAK